MPKNVKYVCKFDEMSDKVLENLKRYPIVIACGICGVSDKTYYRWRSEGAADKEAGNHDTPKAIWYDKTVEMRAKRCQSLYDTVDDAGKVQGQWTAAMRLLESAMPKVFARNAYELQQLEKMREEQQEMKEKIEAFIANNKDK
jgi:hypothetical protein